MGVLYHIKEYRSLQRIVFYVILTGKPIKLHGGMPEWLIGAVLKTVVRASVPRVRIPIPPPFYLKSRKGLFVFVE